MNSIEIAVAALGRVIDPLPDACACRACVPDESMLLRGFRVCRECGNKRCPHAADHRHTCTRSNEPGQPGSIYA